jgi:hypothetical protein
MRLFQLQLRNLRFKNQVPFHQILKHLESAFQPYAGSETPLELKRQKN